MIYNFCTLFNKNYIYQGLALYNSLSRNCSNFQIFILCLDDDTYSILFKLNLKNTKLIKLIEIEDDELLNAKNNRSYGEYCWTLASFFTYHVIKSNKNIEHISYLDSDIYFYSSPKPIYKELNNNSVLIIKHNYSKRLRYLEKNGIYNVAMIVFKNNENGLTVLKQWRDEVLKWCYNKNENGKFGDQGYLNDWPTKFTGIHVLKHQGANLAPWNIENYTITSNKDNILVDEQILIFYHFHTFKIIGPHRFQLHSSFYSFSNATTKLIYGPYIKEIETLIAKIKKIDPSFSYSYQNKESIINKIKQLLKRILILIYFYN